MYNYSKDYYKRYKGFDSSRVSDFIVKNLRRFFQKETPLCVNTAIDIGCGIGGLTYRLKDYSNLTIGIDLSLDALKLTKKSDNKKGFFIQADGVRLPIKDNTCDLCTSIHVIEHIKEPELLLKEIYRVISANGKLILITPNKKWTRLCLPSLRDKTHRKEFSMAELRNLVSRYFYIEAIKPFSMFTSFGILNPMLNVLVKPDISVFAVKK